MKLMVTGALLVALAAAASAQQWPQWRGPARDGRSTLTLPAAFRSAPGTVWKAEVGAGHASPVVDGARVYVFTRRGERETLAALDLASGKEIWAEGEEVPYQMNPSARGHGKGPKSTPLLHEGRIYTLGITGILSARDAATGRLVWRAGFEKEFPSTAPTFGTAMSPVVEGRLLIAHVGTDERGALRAFDPATGAVKWSWTEDGPGYASPVAYTAGGSRHLVTQSSGHIIAVDANSGRTLWTMPFETPYVQNIVTPLVYEDLVVLSGLEQSTFALRTVKRGAGWTTQRVWENRAVPMYMSSPVLVGERLFGHTHRNRGQFFALDAGSGKTIWTSPPRQGETAAIVAAGDRVLFLTDQAELIVVDAAAAGFEPLARMEVASTPTWAHPVPLGSRLLVKDEQHLALLDIGK